MTSTGSVLRDWKRVVLVSIYLRYVTFIVVWTLLIAATGGCRCGTVEHLQPSVGRGSTDGNQSSQRPLETEDRAARLDAIKADILGKLGVDSELNLPSEVDEVGRRPEEAAAVPTLPAYNASIDERRRVINQYRQSIEQLRGKTHRVDDGHLPRAKQFYSFRSVPHNDTISQKVRSEVSTRSMYIRFQLDLLPHRTDNENRSASDVDTPGSEFIVTSSSLKLPRHRSLIRHRGVGRKSSGPQSSNDRMKLRVNIYQVLPDVVADSGDDVIGTIHRRKIRKRLVDSRLIDDVIADVGRHTRRRRRRSFEEFDVIKSVREWTVHPSTNLGLLVVVEVEVEPHSSGNSSTLGVTPRIVRAIDLFEPPAATSSSVGEGPRRRDSTGRTALSSVETDLDSGPTLTVLGRQRTRSSGRDDLTGDRRKRSGRRRSRRSSSHHHHHDNGGGENGDCRPGDGETRCCRHPLWVSFREIGWDQWIIAPEGYMAYYCDGSCPPQHRVASRHASVQALVNGARPEAAPSPCCTPSRMSSLPIAHLNSEGRPVVSVFDNMIVDECMCT